MSKHIIISYNDNDNDNSLLDINVVIKWIIVDVHTLFTKFTNMFWYSTLCKETNHGSEINAWEHTATSLISKWAMIILFWTQCQDFTMKNRMQISASIVREWVMGNREWPRETWGMEKWWRCWLKVACYNCLVIVEFTYSYIDVVHIMSVSKIAVENRYVLY